MCTTIWEFYLDAFNQTLKPSMVDNVHAGAGGVLVGTAASSITNANHTTNALIGDRVDIRVRDDISSVGTFSVIALNDIAASDKVKNTAYGLIVGAGSESKVKANFNSLAAVGEGASIDASGEVVIAARSNGDVKVAPRVKTGGVASAGKIDGLAEVNADNDVRLNPDVIITAKGNVHLLAGTGLNGARDRLDGVNGQPESLDCQG